MAWTENPIKAKLDVISSRLDDLEKRLAETEVAKVFSALAALETRLAEVESAEVVIAPGDAHPAGMSPEHYFATRVIDVAIARLEPTQDDIVVFWLPSYMTHSQVADVQHVLSAVIDGRFRHFVFVRNAIGIEIVQSVPGGIV